MTKQQCEETRVGVLPESPKMFVLVRRDLPWPVRCVQAMHAVMQLSRDIGYKIGWGRYGPSVVLLGVQNEAELTTWLEQLGPYAVGFREPDLSESLTAVAWYGEQTASLAELRLM
jgi:hypothetical protein